MFARLLSATISGVMLLLLVVNGASAALPFEALPDRPPIPEDNPMSEAKAELGKQLFFDPRLSVTVTHSCNSCHNVARGGMDALPVSIGVNGRVGRRNTLSIWNAAYHTAYNWDGSARTLEEQFEAHLRDPLIMAVTDADLVVERLKQIEGYRQQFDALFGGEGITLNTIAKAVATYERTLVTPGSLFDRYLNGESGALSEQGKRGFRQFVDVGCAACHFWVNLAGPTPGVALKQGEGFYELFPNYPGTHYEKQYRLSDDLGRYHITGDESDKRMWRMPGLRNIADTAPYFHNGSVETLAEAVRVMALTQLEKELTEPQVEDIIVFLQSLTGPYPQQRLPRLPGSSAWR